MSTKHQNLSNYDPASVPDAKGFRFAIAVSEWNFDITSALLQGAQSTLLAHGAYENDIEVFFVPGSFELTAAATLLAGKESFDAIICLGCVIQGETRHFDFICQAVANGLTEVSLRSGIPAIFGVLTPDNMDQAVDRAGGKHGNKGVEAAVTAIKMADLAQKLQH